MEGVVERPLDHLPRPRVKVDKSDGVPDVSRRQDDLPANRHGISIRQRDSQLNRLLRGHSGQRIDKAAADAQVVEAQLEFQKAHSHRIEGTANPPMRPLAFAVLGTHRFHTRGTATILPDEPMRMSLKLCWLAARADLA